MRALLSISCTLFAVAVAGCSGNDGQGLIGPDAPGSSSSDQELNQTPGASAGSSGASSSGSRAPGGGSGGSASGSDSTPTPAPTSTGTSPPSTPPTTPPPPPQAAYTLTIDGVTRAPVDAPEAVHSTLPGSLAVHAVLARAQGLSPEENVDVIFPQDKAGSYGCDLSHGATWVSPEKAIPRLFVSKADSSCHVDVTRLDAVGGWVEGTAHGTFVWNPIIGPAEQKSFTVSFRVPRKQ